MRRSLTIAAAAFALLVAGCNRGGDNVIAPPAGGQKIVPIKPPAGGDWTQMVSETADGGYRMGNPNAPVRLLEYGSFGCPHCAEFEGEAAEPLKSYIGSGRVSWEFRSLHIFGFDPAVSLLMRCHGPEAYFLLKQQLYATQPDWERKFQEWANQKDIQDQLQRMPPQQRLKPMITAPGLDEFFRQRGMPASQIDACLADTKGLERVLDVSQRGSTDFGVTGTPTFFINGIKVPDTGTWPQLEPQLKRALGE